ncbi:MAG: hypothetical protein RRY07_02505 [Bacteroidaceae bacterium]
MNKKRKMQALATILLCGTSLISCSVDNSYDLDQDIDMTMGLGSNGLALKLGSTAKTYLKDLLKVEDSEMLETTGTNLYYLKKDGSSNVSVKVDAIDPFKIKDINIDTDPIYTAPISGSLPEDVTNETHVKGKNNIDVHITSIPTEVKEIHGIKFNNVLITINYDVYRNDHVFPGFHVDGVKNLKFVFPDFIYLNKGAHSYTHNKVGEITIPIDSIVLPSSADSKYGMLVKDGKIDLSGSVSVSGDFKTTIKKGTSVQEGDNAYIKMNVDISEVAPSKVSGLMDPVINPTVDPINIKNDLPDFLDDEAVTLNVTNPTIRFDMAGTSLPIDLDFKATLMGYKSVNVPATGVIGISKKQNSTFYIYQGSTPFDPTGVEEKAEKYKVPTLNTLLTKIPEEIKIDLSNDKVTTNKAKMHEVDLPMNCNVDMKYNVLVPFRFGKDLCIVYSDSVDDMNKDLKDYDAEGVTITSTAINSIPLDLLVKLVPIDVNGKEISKNLLEVSEATIKAAPLTGDKTETKITLTLTAKQKGVVSKLDKFKFKITAKSEIEGNGELMSDQYIELKDLRLKLNGKIIANFN